MKKLPFTGHQQDTSVVVTINHCYQYCSGKEGGTKESNKDWKKDREKERKRKKRKKVIIWTKVRAIRP